MNTLLLPANLDSLELASQFVARAATHVGLDDHAAWQVQLAVDEAVTNIIQHSYEQQDGHELHLSWALEHGALVITLRDQGRRFDPTAIPAPDITLPLEDREPGGLGIFLMNKLMDTVTFTFDEQQGNLLVMTKQVPPPIENTNVFALSGRLDAVATQQALERPRAAIAGGVRRVLLDLSDVTFMSSSGLRALLLLRKDILAAEGELRLCALRPQVYEVFNLTGFTQVFAIHPTREDALAAFGRG